MLTKLIKINIWVKVLILLLLVHSIVNLSWVFINNAPLPWDSANHAFISIRIAELIAKLDLLGILKASNYYPIFIHLLTGLTILFVGPQIKFIELLGTIYFLLTLTVIFLYVKFLTKKDSLALVVTILFSFYPVVFNWSRFLMLDIPNVGLLILSLYFFEKSNAFYTRKFTLLFFISAAFLFMTKWTGLIYLFVPLLISLINFYKSAKKIVVIKNSLIGLAIFFMIAAPWYLSNLKDIIYLGQIYSVDHSNPDQPIRVVVASFTDYYKIFIRDQISPIPALFFFISLPFFILSKFKPKWFILSIILVSYFLFSLLGNKDSRFTMHLLVFSSLITAIGLLEINKFFKKAGSILLVLMGVFLFGYYLILSFRPVMLEGYKLQVNLPVLGLTNVINISDEMAKNHDTNNWSLPQILDDLNPLVGQKKSRVLVVSEWRHLNPSNLRTYSYVSGLQNIEIVTADIVYLKERFNLDHFPDYQKLKNFIESNNYLIMADENLGSPILLNGKALRQIQAFVRQNSLPMCNLYQANISPTETYCQVDEGEEFISESDLQIDNGPVLKGEKIIKGYSLVYCKWGCTFGQLKVAPVNKKTILKRVRQYVLPNNQRVDLYKIN